VRLVLLWLAHGKTAARTICPLGEKSAGPFPAHDRQGRPQTGRFTLAIRAVALQSDARASAPCCAISSRGPVHTVIMVQVETSRNMGGTSGLFPGSGKGVRRAGAAELLQALKIDTGAGGNWTAVFGANATSIFMPGRWALSSGRLPPPQGSVPIADVRQRRLARPLTPGRPAVMKAAARQIMCLIYGSGSSRHRYSRPGHLPERQRKVSRGAGSLWAPDNALFVPETIGAGANARCVRRIVARSDWVSPFGLDYTRLTEEALAPVGLNYRMLEPIMGEVARLISRAKSRRLKRIRPRVETLDLARGRPSLIWRNGRRKIADAPETPPPSDARWLHNCGEPIFGHRRLLQIDFKARPEQRDFLRVEEAAPVERTAHSSAKVNGGPAPSAFRVLRFGMGTRPIEPEFWLRSPSSARHAGTY